MAKAPATITSAAAIFKNKAPIPLRFSRKYKCFCFVAISAAIFVKIVIITPIAVNTIPTVIRVPRSKLINLNMANAAAIISMDAAIRIKFLPNCFIKSAVYCPERFPKDANPTATACKPPTIDINAIKNPETAFQSLGSVFLATPAKMAIAADTIINDNAILVNALPNCFNT